MSSSSGKSAFDSAAHGVPINQEDLAYTRLTFGYCIPKGLAKLGRFWGKKRKKHFYIRGKQWVSPWGFTKICWWIIGVMPNNFSYLSSVVRLVKQSKQKF